MFTNVDKDIHQFWKNATLQALKQFISIPCLSPGFDPQWETHGYLHQALEEARQWGATLFPNGIFEILSESGRSPCLFFDIPATQPDEARSVVFYGHLDKQPEAEGWTAGREPFVPVVEGNRLYGRGAADDGYSVYCALTAVATMERNAVPHPRVFGLIETREESGSGDLPHWLSVIASRCENIGLITILDADASDYERLWITTSFRGIVAASLKVETIRNAMHSGEVSGVVPGTFMIARNLLDRIENSENGEVLGTPFQCAIPAARNEQLKKAARILGEQYKTAYPWVGTAHSRHEDSYTNLLAQTWKPQLTVIGADGFPSVSTAGNIMRPSTTLMLSIRIPPRANPKEALTYMKATLAANPPYGAKISFAHEDALPGWDAAQEKKWFAKAVDQASMELFGKPAAYIASGGSISILGLFEKTFPSAQFFVTGVLGPHSNAHGPDEMLRLDYVEKITCAIARILATMINERGE